MREVKLPSGAVLKVGAAPFAAAKALYQATLSEARGVPLASDSSMAELMKNLLCTGFSSALIDRAMKPCLERSTYNDQKITDDTFEPVEARQDYMIVMKEVAEENVGPFVKSLYAEWMRGMETAAGILGSKSGTTTS